MVSAVTDQARDLFEAGNRALSPGKTDLVAGIDSLSLLTTNKDFVTDPLTPFCGTSPATAQAAGMAAALMAAFPDYWPETIRALMVHSARWTPVNTLSFTSAARGFLREGRVLSRSSPSTPSAT